MTTHINLQFRHASADLRKLARALPFPVSMVWVAGTKRKTVQGHVLKGTYEESYLSMKVESSSGTISGAVTAVKEAFMGVPDDVRLALADPSLRKCLYCTLNGTGEAIGLDSLRTLVEQGIELWID